MATTEEAGTPASLARYDRKDALQSSSKLRSFLDRTSSMTSPAFSSSSPDNQTHSDGIHGRASSDVDQLLKSTKLDSALLSDVSSAASVVHHDSGPTLYRSIDSSTLKSLLAARTTSKILLPESVMESSTEGLGSPSGSNADLIVPEPTRSVPESELLALHEKRFNSLRSMAHIQGAVSGDLTAADMASAMRQNSSLSTEFVRVGTITENLISGSWNEDRAELAAAQARAQQRARSFFQKAEETYQLQAAVALRVMADAELAEETEMRTTNSEHADGEDAIPGTNSWAGNTLEERGQAEATAYRFWVTSCLHFEDRIEDGFFDVWGLSPWTWSLCSDSSQRGRMPSLEGLKALSPSEAGFEATLVMRARDPQLRELEDSAVEEGFRANEVKALARRIGVITANHMGGAVQSEINDLVPRYRQRSFEVKNYARTIVIPIGQVSVGLCRHRAILFKLLMDMVEQKCRIAQGCKFCGMDDGASCIVVDNGREYVVDLIQDPGALDPALPMWQHPICSPLRWPMVSHKSLAPKDWADGEPNWLPEFRNFRRSSLPVDFDPTAAIEGDGSPRGPAHPQAQAKKAQLQVARKTSLGKEGSTVAGNIPLPALPQLPLDPSSKHPLRPEQAPLPMDSRGPQGIGAGALVGAVSGIAGDESQAVGVDLMPIILSEHVMDVGNMEITWEDIELGERVGAGTFGTVSRAEWNGSDVAVKVLINQEQSEEQLSEFRREVIMMEKLRHPNIVLFMGAVTKPPNLSIVTEFMQRGSLFRLLHRPGAKDTLKEERRLRMAMDVARGVNYLHKCNPMIVHRDLKSPNLLVDKNWTVKVCDFGLSANKNSTFLSSKSGAGTPEWMAPEVLRNEPSDEKSDVYSFGVILWEIATLQQPWEGMNPMQVVGAVGFQHKRLECPESLSQPLTVLIKSCWENKPSDRPSFTEIISKLKPMVIAAQKQAQQANKPPSGAD